MRWVASGVAGGLVVAAVAAWLWLRGADLWLVQPMTPVRAAAPDAEPLSVPGASEASMSRARALQTKGRLHEALAALDGVPYGDDAWLDAQALRAAIQRQLLTGAGTPLPVPDGTLGQGARQ